MALLSRKTDFVLNILVMCTVVVMMWAMHTIVFELIYQRH